MNIIHVIKEKGIAAFCKSIFVSVGFKIGTYYAKLHYLTLDIDIEHTKKRLDGFNFEIKELRYEDFLKGNPKEFTAEKLAFIKQRLNDPTYKAYGIFEDDYLIYSTWFSLRKLGLPIEMKKPIYMSEDEGLLEDSYCDPKARGRGIHSKMNDFRIMKLHELGKKRVLALVMHGNTPAFKTQFKSGFKVKKCFLVGKIFGIPFCTI